MKGFVVTDSFVPSIFSVFIDVRAITLGPFIFCKEADPAPRLIAHERVHVQQWLELWVVGFLPLYIGCWIYALAVHRNARSAYLAIPFEQEARSLAWADDGHLRRRRFGWRAFSIRQTI